MPIEDDIRKALRKAMEAGRNSTDIANETGIHAVTIRKFKGGKTMTTEYLEKLAVALGLQVVVVKHPKKK